MLGDDGVLYKSLTVEMVEIYKNSILPLADQLKLNQTEIQLLSECSIQNESDAWFAINKIHEKGILNVVISSVFYIENNIIGVIGSFKNTTKALPQKYQIEVPKINRYFTGTGDLFSALLLAWSTKTDMISSLRNTVTSIQEILSDSQQQQLETLQFTEIRLIPNSKSILEPNLKNQIFFEKLD